MEQSNPISTEEVKSEASKPTMNINVIARGPDVIVMANMGVLATEFAVTPELAVQIAQLMTQAAFLAKTWKPENPEGNTLQ